MRDLYWTFRNFRNRVADFLRYRRVTANMDERFPDATPEELEVWRPVSCDFFVLSVMTTSSGVAMCVH